MPAMFEFAGGALSVTPSTSDTYVAFEIFNVGDRPSVSLGAVASGNHTALVYVNPGSGQNDHLSQDFTV